MKQALKERFNKLDWNNEELNNIKRVEGKATPEYFNKWLEVEIQLKEEEAKLTPEQLAKEKREAEYRRNLVYSVIKNNKENELIKKQEGL